MQASISIISINHIHPSFAFSIRFNEKPTANITPIAVSGKTINKPAIAAELPRSIITLYPKASNASMERIMKGVVFFIKR